MCFGNTACQVSKRISSDQLSMGEALPANTNSSTLKSNQNNRFLKLPPMCIKTFSASSLRPKCWPT